MSKCGKRVGTDASVKCVRVPNHNGQCVATMPASWEKYSAGVLANDDKRLMTRKQMALKLGRRVRTLRNKAKLSVADFACILGMTMNNLYRIERGNSNVPRTDTVVRIASALGVEPTAIFSALDTS